MEELRRKEEKRERREGRRFSFSKVKLVAVLVIVALVFAGGMGFRQTLDKMWNKTEVTTDYISGKLENVGELTTQKVTYSARLTVEKGEIPFITKKGFTMVYNATMTAGIKMEDMKIKTADKKVVITVPHATVISNKVDPDSIQFYDEKKALFNWSTKDDVSEAISMAEKDVKENPTVDTEELLNKADEHLEELIHALLDDSVDGREVVVEFE